VPTTLMRACKGFSLLGTLIVALLLTTLIPIRCLGQSDSASVSGRVTDQQNAVIPNVEVEMRNVDTNATQVAKTNGDGTYSFPSLRPGNYVMSVRKEQFQTVSVTGIALHVQDSLSRNFVLQVGSSSVSVTVTADSVNVNTTDGAVSTVVDESYVKNMPLNGRSFQSLILLTPGVVTNTPQSTGAIGAAGEFSVNGQRTESNYYSVDGVSANTGAFAGAYQFPSVSGSLPASTALGTTQGLVSVEALEEFRVQSSTYSAEYGRNPGGQFSFATKSGVNQWHGTLFEYLRNDLFDANNWFNNYDGLSKTPLRQNDFGGTVGGPVKIPRLYDGQNRTFFFFNYEGLRLLQPEEASTSYVPDQNLRNNTAAPLDAVMKAFPLPNGPEILDGSGQSIGLAEFTAGWSNPSQIDSYSLRLDHNFGQRLKLFFRFARTDSTNSFRDGGNSNSPSSLVSRKINSRSYTLGATQVLSNSFSNDFRVNYSSTTADAAQSLDNFGGAEPVSLAQMQGLSGHGADNVYMAFCFDSAYCPELFEFLTRGEQRQWNLVDTVSHSLGKHLLKYGIDYRRLAPIQEPYTPSIGYIFYSQASAVANNIDDGISATSAAAHPIYKNVSAFIQDSWRVGRRLNLSMGLRWEVNPAPGDAKGNLPYTVEGNSITDLQLAPRGKPLWETAWFNFAPRLGLSYILRENAGFETVLRGGGGVFFDTGQQNAGWAYYGPGFQASTVFGSFEGTPATFPIPLSEATPPIINPPTPPYGTVYAFSRHLQLPYTLQWNIALEQALGKSQALTFSYVGANGRRLLQEQESFILDSNPNFNTLFLFNNGLTSDYGALQVQFQRRLSQGLTALASYTWSHAIDYGSRNAALQYERGNSDFDVRHSASAAVSYSLPSKFENGLTSVVFSNWGLDDRFTIRTGFPVTLQGPLTFDPATGKQTYAGLDLVPGQPVYLHGDQFPGGQAVNGSAFAIPAGCSRSFCPNPTSGDAPRNFVRGFGAWQMDLAVRREFPIVERLKLQFRAEAFNLFNHPSFGKVDANFCSPSATCTFGRALQTLSSSLGVLSPLYQMGGPRSMQFSLKLAF
jgi:Carboxypeptidase regulatory-like domain